MRRGTRRDGSGFPDIPPAQGRLWTRYLLGVRLVQLGQGPAKADGYFVLRHARHQRDLGRASTRQQQAQHPKFVRVKLMAARKVVVDRTCHGRMIIDALRSEEHTSELQSLLRTSFAVF